MGNVRKTIPIQRFLRELRNDELMFKKCTRVSSETFDYILKIISEKLQNANANSRMSIEPDWAIIGNIIFQ